MVTINTAQRYTFSNEGLNSGSNFLTPAKDNNSIVLEFGNVTGKNEEKWYLSNSGDEFYFRIHNAAKGDDWALETTGSTDSDDAATSVFFAKLNRTEGQFWRIYEVKTDGKWRITSLLGPEELFLGVNENLRIADLGDDLTEANQQWALNTVSSESLVSSTSTAKASFISGSTRSASTTCASASSSCTIVPSSSDKSPLSKGAIAGVAIGGVALLCAIIGLFVVCLKQRKKKQRREAAENAARDEAARKAARDREARAAALRAETEGQHDIYHVEPEIVDRYPTPPPMSHLSPKHSNPLLDRLN